MFGAIYFGEGYFGGVLLVTVGAPCLMHLSAIPAISMTLTTRAVITMTLTARPVVQMTLEAL
jgi:hypothetical protein